MVHELAGVLQQAGWIRQRYAVKHPVSVRAGAIPTGQALIATHHSRFNASLASLPDLLSGAKDIALLKFRAALVLSFSLL
jgi:hypothetical protein